MGFHRVTTGLLCLTFVVSAALTFLGPEETADTMARLGFPTYFMYPQGIAKLAAVGAILSRRSPTLTVFAFAGLFFDMVLALGAHVAERDPQGWLAVFGLVVWAGAFWSELRRASVDSPVLLA